MSNKPVARVAVVLVGAAMGGSLLTGCGGAELMPAPDVVSAAPQLFENGPGVVVVDGSASPDEAEGGPLWWFTAQQGELGVYNGSDQSASVRVSADVVVPCSTPARLEVSLPDGRSRTVPSAQGRPGRVRFAVQVPARGSVDVGIQIDATACQPPSDSRTLYAGLQSLRARAADPAA